MSLTLARAVVERTNFLAFLQRPVVSSFSPCPHEFMPVKWAFALFPIDRRQRSAIAGSGGL
jgi:hypothetical protein